MTNPSYPLISFGLNDAPTKAGISSVVDIYGIPSGSNKWSFSNLNDLSVGNKTVVPYATFEPDYWVLDGNHHFMPATPKIGYMDSYLSDASGNTNTDVVTIFFSALTTVQNMTLYFDVNQGEWCSSIKVEAFTGGGSLIAGTGTVSPTSSIYQVSLTAANADHVNITIYKTSHAYRFARLTGIDFGDTTGYVTILDKTKIKSAKITEEFSPICETLTANSLDLDLVLSTSDFSVVNPSSPYLNLQQYTPFTVYEVFNNEYNLFGVYYLDGWDNGSTPQEIIFHCYDAIYRLGKLPFYGFIYGGLALSSFISYLFANTGINYTLTASGLTTIVYMPPASLRDALQQLGMAFRMSILTSGSLVVKLAPVVLAKDTITPSYTIGLSNEWIEQVKLLTPVAGVRMRENGWINIVPPPALATIYTASLGVGDYVVTFNQNNPYGPLTISGATFDSPIPFNGGYTNMNYYCKFTVSSPGTVTVQSNGLAQSMNIEDILYEPGTIPTAVQIVDINETVDSNVGAGTRLDQATWIYGYYSQRYWQSANVFGMIVHAGDVIQIASQSGKNLMACIEKAEIELVGLKSDIEVVGRLI